MVQQLQRMLSKLEEKYNVKLDDTQKNVLSSLTKFLKSPNKAIVVSGKAGTGKSTLITFLLELFGYKNAIYLATPTNKSLQALALKADLDICECGTLHSFLNLRPNLNILEFDASELEFTAQGRRFTPYDIVIVDECSMINDHLYNSLMQYANEYNFKIIFFGDSAQLAPIKQGFSKVFSLPNLQLNKVYRQAEGCLYPILEKLRVRPIYKFYENSDENNTILIYNKITDMLKQYAYLFKFAADCKETNIIKALSYTNERVSSINNFIRKCIYNDDCEYHIGEFITGCDTVYSNSCTIIENSQDYIIKEIIPAVFEIRTIKFDGYMITTEDAHKMCVISRNNTASKFKLYAKLLDTMRKEAVKYKSTAMWNNYYEVSKYLVPFDLKYDGRTVKKKSLDYGYCITVHKSQASEYQHVIIDMEGLWTCPNKVTLRQLQYVALSRTTGSLLIYQKDEK